MGGRVRRHERVRVLGDKHPGQWVPFWQQACAADTRTACEDLYFQQDGYCEEGSGWACNELGILLAEHYANPMRAAASFERACTLQFAAGCDNSAAMPVGGMFRRDAPTVADYRLVLRGSKGPIQDREPAQLYARACDQGFPAPAGGSSRGGCGRMLPMKLTLTGTVAALCLLVGASSSQAQLLAAKDAPVAYGHHHLNVTDIPANLKFFGDALGGTPITVAGRQMVKFPNVLVFLRQQKPTAGSKGSSVDHLGFSVPDLRAAVDKIKANGYRMVTKEEAPAPWVVADDLASQAGRDIRIAFAMGPDDLKVEIVEGRRSRRRSRSTTCTSPAPTTRPCRSGT